MDNPKGLLIERLQRDGQGQPTFSTERSGPDHEPLFESEVTVGGDVLGSGSGGSKRDAERRAAEAALTTLDDTEPHDAADEPDEFDEPELDLPFDGPWPLFEQVLAASIRTADARTDGRLKGEGAIDAVQALALRLYKGVLEELGEVIEVDEAD
jgi:ribonuclease-3